MMWRWGDRRHRRRTVIECRAGREQAGAVRPSPNGEEPTIERLRDLGVGTRHAAGRSEIWSGNRDAGLAISPARRNDCGSGVF
jgi:hypothetical protein